jgi:chromosomal replication initiator protein
MKENQNAQWEHALAVISENVSEQQYNTWFKTIVFESFTESTKTVLVQVPSPFVYEYLEENYVDLLSKVLRRVFCDGVRLAYRVVTDREHRLTQRFEGKEPEVAVQPKRRANESPTVLDAMVPQELDPQLNGEMTFSTFIEGDSNKFPRSVG